MDSQQVVLARWPAGTPVEADFALRTVQLPEPAEGEVLVRNRLLSLDPYMRSQIAGRHLSGAIAPGDLMRGETVAEVLVSRHPGFQPGDCVRGFGQWQTHAVLAGDALAAVPPEIDPPSLALSLLGMPGLTAWAGLHWLAQVQPGEVLVVPAATGAVGAAVGQFARLAGCRVIGVAGGAAKCRTAVEVFGYAACIDRHQGDLAGQLDRHCPDGIHVYFDLVGGELLIEASARLAQGARVVLCGLMAEANQSERGAGPPPGYWIRARATVHGLVVYDFEDRRQAFIEAVLPQVRSGALRWLEDFSEGIASAPAAFCRLMRGENHGKVLVRL